MAAADREQRRGRSGPGIQSGARASVAGEDPEHADWGIGDVIAGKYELGRPIRRGGMGEVWVARNTALDADVAIKLIRSERASPEAAERLLTEARAVARLGHASIVRVFDFGTTASGDPFLVMELLAGEPFDRVLSRRTRLPAPNAVQTLLPVASALTAAHAEGIVHRDIKPENILLVTDKMGAIVPKLLDFGIAKLAEAGGDERVTQRGVVLGSPAYMAPEQAIGDTEIDGRADIWSFCLVLYETIAGKLPFETESYRKLVHQILTRDPVPFTDLEVGDELLWSIVERGLAKDKRSRWATMRELGEALAKWSLRQRIKSDIAGTSIRRHWLGRSIAPTPMPSDSLLLLADPAERSGGKSEPPPGDLDISLPPVAPAEPEVPMPPRLRRGVMVGGVVLVAAAIVAISSSSSAPPLRLQPLAPLLARALQIEIDELEPPAAAETDHPEASRGGPGASAAAHPAPRRHPGRHGRRGHSAHPDKATRAPPARTGGQAPPVATARPIGPGGMPVPPTPDF